MKLQINTFVSGLSTCPRKFILQDAVAGTKPRFGLLDSLQDNFGKSQTGIKPLTVGLINGVAMKMGAWRICFTTCRALTTGSEYFVGKDGYFNLHPRTL